jgi:hypothetical protein
VIEPLLSPRPPQWALDAGLPPPVEGESFCAYIERLGLDCDYLLEGLTGRTLPCANSRLASLLMRELPDAFWAYAEKRRLAAIGKR